MRHIPHSVPRQTCDNCPSRPRSIYQVIWQGRKLFLCDACRRVLVNLQIKAQHELQTQPQQESTVVA